MKGNAGSGDPEGREAKTRLASSGRGRDTSGEKGFFADALRYELVICQQCVCPGVLLGKFAEFMEHLTLRRPRRTRGGHPRHRR